MAARRMVRRGRRRNWVSRQEHFWATAFENASIANNVIRFTPIVAPTDWIVRVGNAQANLVRIHGSVHVRPNYAGSVGARNQNLMFAVIKVDADDAASFNPATSVSYINHDVLWTHQGGIHTLNESGARLDNFHVDFDIKAQRKLRSDDYVYLVMYNLQGTTVGEAVHYMAITRALLVVK